MKKYIKPNTEVYAVELQKMIAESFTPDSTQQLGAGDFLGKEDNTLPTTNSVWDEEE